MSKTVTLTQAEMIALFERWNKESAENGWENNPLDPKSQAEYFFQIAKELEDKRD